MSSTRRLGPNAPDTKKTGGFHDKAYDSDDDGFETVASDTTLHDIALKVDFFDKAKTEAFFSSNIAAFAAQKNGKRNILHDIAEESRQQIREQYSQYKERLKVILTNHPSLLSGQNEQGYTPLHCALSKKNKTFVVTATENPKIKEDLGQIFAKQDNNRDNVLCWASKLHYIFLEDMITACLPSVKALEQRDVHGNTILHLAVGNIWDRDDQRDRQLSLVGLLVKAHSKVLTQKNSAGNTPFQLRQDVLRKGGRRDSNTDKISQLIKTFCMRNLARNEAIDALYKTGEERHLEFDLAGLPNPTITTEYLNSLSGHLKFESILKYVALPKLSIVPDDGYTARIENGMEMKAGKKKKKSQKGLRDMETIFSWLKANGVKQIIKVIVVDNGDVAHTDEAIENCLSDFNVEIWNWKRIDLCAEVIQKSAGHSVREISLYSSGNNAVLSSWAGADGLGNPENFPLLERVNLYVQEGLETSQRLSEYIERFKQKLRKGFEERKKPTVCHFLDTGYSFSGSFATSNSNHQSEHAWLKTMDHFVECILQLLPEDPKKDIKIAVIDDGVDASLESVKGKIASGNSFCPYPNSNDLISSYFVPSSTSHGTIMADLICRICPRVKLYVARLDEGYALHGKRQITAKSAAAAIRWAVKCGVDIISMSWTIESTSNDSATASSNALNPLEDLVSALDEAGKSNILMFGAASDQGSASKICYPAESDKCIPIGAATETGEICPWVHQGQAKYTCPGYKVPFKRGDGTQPSYHNGSSVATAIASGLAGLILYCDRLAGSDEDKKLKSKKGMSDAFFNMSIVPSGDMKFPRVGQFFTVESSEKEKWKVLSQDDAEDESMMTGTEVKEGLSPTARNKLNDILRRLKEPRHGAHS
ncbi:hypothetical protein TWF718_003068 [Orbilia javanica]|uniref:Peptidase S8/S53 domain-containing protein n=1 Tax=Orbilia javanica TaxID=47235 RepID=A0AAN8RAK5_9PEZI